MGRLIDEIELEKYIMHDGCEKGCGYIDERDLKYIQPVEAIPKADYENRLKADMVALLEEIDLQFDEICFYKNMGEWKTVPEIKAEYKAVIREKINSLKEAD